MQARSWKIRILLAVLSAICAFSVVVWLRPAPTPPALPERERSFSMGISGAAPQPTPTATQPGSAPENRITPEAR